MEPVFQQIRERARSIVKRYPIQSFYQEHEDAMTRSRTLFDGDPTIGRLRDFVEQNMRDNLGHGLDHAIKVTLDAGALMIIEGRRAGYSDAGIDRYAFLAQCAGLLHDIKRSQQKHAERGAVFIRKTLSAWKSFQAEEVACIACAVQNHEAFTRQLPSRTPADQLVSDCLYDADKFRWGPDNFTHTVWDMVASADIPLAVFVSHYPKGMLALEKIKASFRTQTGRQYGPLFIETGLAVGRELYCVIQQEFADQIC